MVIDIEESDRSIVEELIETIGEDNFYKNHFLLKRLAFSRLECVKLFEDIAKTERAITAGILQQVALPKVFSMSYVAKEDTSKIITVYQEISGSLNYYARANKKGYEPKILSVRYNDVK
jgi:hypothetical protein